MINTNKIWNEALQDLSSKMLAISFEVWIEKLVPLCINNAQLVLIAPNESAKKCILKNYKDVINSSITKVNKTLSGAVIITEDEKDSYLENATQEMEEPVKQENMEDGFTQFTKKYTFDNFVIGKSNEFAAAAGLAVSEYPGEKYNPLFIYGGVGLGKTHLMHAIGNHIRKTRPSLKVRYITCETFVNEFVESIKQKSKSDTMREFREKYRSVDVLMIDDIQFIAGKPGFQEGIFHTFNDLYQNNKQIILTSDRPPKEINPLEERLRTRFEWGLIADIQPPDLETRIAILSKKAEQQNKVYPLDLLTFIAEKVDSNIREMEGLLSRVIFYSDLIKKDATIAIAEEALRDYVDTKKETITAWDIINTTCNYFNITTADITGKKKNKNIVLPRQIAIYLITDLLNLPLVSIGELFGGKDHTTIIYARDKIAELVKTDTKIKLQINDIKDMIYKR